MRKKERKSIRETCPHFQCGTRQSLVFSWVHQISILTQFCSTFFTVWHKFVPAFFAFGTVLYQLFFIDFTCFRSFWSQFEFEKAVEFRIVFRKKTTNHFSKMHFFYWHKLCQWSKKDGTVCAKPLFCCKQVNPWLCQGWQWNCKHVFLMLFLCFWWVREFFCMIWAPAGNPRRRRYFWKKSLRVNGHSL